MDANGELKANAMLAALQGQRDRALNDCVALAAELSIAKARIKELEDEKEGEKK